jgi:hypothetical protein
MKFGKTFFTKRFTESDFREERLSDSCTVPVLFIFFDVGVGYLAFCDRSLAGIAGSNHAGCMDVSVAY